MGSQSHSVEERARQVCEPLIAAEGLELLDVEFVREHNEWILRLFIDNPGGGVGVDECQKASAAVDTALDVEDFITQAYSLEVSSPGLNRPLKKPEHFQKALGQKVRVKTFGPLGEPPRKNFLGALKSASADAIAVEVEGAGTFTIALKDVAKANLEFEFTK
ncbi:MAG: ribosome maturation factor RimP [Myxococcaceae bacterium]|nr:ribosome maturation factor RimP [Myxococcaceae bacterium]